MSDKRIGGWLGMMLGLLGGSLQAEEIPVPAPPPALAVQAYPGTYFVPTSQGYYVPYVAYRYVPSHFYTGSEWQSLAWWLNPQTDIVTQDDPDPLYSRRPPEAVPGAATGTMSPRWFVTPYYWQPFYP